MFYQPVGGVFDIYMNTKTIIILYLSPTTDETRPLIGQLARGYDLVCRSKSLYAGVSPKCHNAMMIQL